MPNARRSTVTHFCPPASRSLTLSIFARAKKSLSLPEGSFALSRQVFTAKTEGGESTSIHMGDNTCKKCELSDCSLVTRTCLAKMRKKNHSDKRMSLKNNCVAKYFRPRRNACDVGRKIFAKRREPKQTTYLARL